MGVSLQFAFCHHRNLQEVIVLQGKVMDQPRTKRQQESEHKHYPVSPVDIQRFQNLMKQILHWKFLIQLLLLCRIAEILYKRLLAYTDLDIVIHLNKNRVLLDFSYCSIDTADSNDLVTLLE